MSIFNKIRLTCRYFYQKRSRFPQAVEVAVGVDRFDFIALAERKTDFRLFAGMQFLALIALLGVERDPLDVVLRQHGMLHRADLNMDDAVFHRPDGDVLFNRRVGRAGNDLAHRLTAADDGNARVLDLGNDVAAMLANVKLLLHDDSPFLSLIILRVNFKVALGVVAGRANLRRLLADHDMPAVAALPHLDLALGKDLRHLHIVQQGTVALLMVLFNGGYQAETLGQLMETFLIGGFGKAVVHIRPLVVLALSGGEKVFGGVTNAVQLLEPKLSVFLLVVSGFEEQRRDLLVAFLLGLGGKIGVLVACLGLTGKGGHQVFFGLSTCVFRFFHGGYSFLFFCFYCSKL